METKITVTEIDRDEAAVIATDETTGIRARGDSVPTALTTLAQKLEIELVPG